MIDKQIEEMLRQHLPDRATDTLACYEAFKHDDWKDLDEEGNLKGFVSYFFLDFTHDMLITAANNNTFSKTHFKVVKDTVLNRDRPLRISADQNKKILHKLVEKYGGKFFEGEIWFREPGESYV